MPRALTGALWGLSLLLAMSAATSLSVVGAQGTAQPSPAASRSEASARQERSEAPQIAASPEASDLLPLARACDASGRPGPTAPERPVPFAPGEVLEYDITRVPYVVSGTATVTVLEKRRACGSVVYRIVAEGQPVPLLARLYRLRYRAATVLDAANLLPYAGAIYSEEGRRRRLKVTRFDPLSRSVRFELETSTRMTKELPARAGGHDPLSLLFALRSEPLNYGQRMTVSVSDSGRWYSVTVRIDEHEEIATGLGDLPARRVHVEARDEAGRRPFRALTLWLADDARRWPVKLVADLSVGPLTFTLRSARPR